MRGKNLFRKVIMFCMITGGAFFLSISLAQAAETLKIGIIGPLSGPGATWGQSMTQGVEMFIEDLEKAGGLTVKGKKYKLEMIPYDDKFNAAEGSKAATRLVQVDKVKFIIGSIGSASIASLQPITEKAQVITIGNGYAKSLLGPQHPWYWRIIGTNLETSGPMINYLTKEKNIKKVAIISTNDESGVAVGEVDRDFWKKAGVEVVYYEYFDRTLKDFYSHLNRILPLGVDAIDTGAAPSGTEALFIKQARELGFKKPIVSGANPDTTAMLGIAGTAALEETYYAMAIDSLDPKYKDFIARWEKKVGREFTYAGPLMWYGAAEILIMGIKKAQTVTDTVAIQKALDGLGIFNTINGKSYFGGKETYGVDRQLIMPVFVKKVAGGKEFTVKTILPTFPGEPKQPKAKKSKVKTK